MSAGRGSSTIRRLSCACRGSSSSSTSGATGSPECEGWKTEWLAVGAGEAEPGGASHRAQRSSSPMPHHPHLGQLYKAAGQQAPQHPARVPVVHLPKAGPGDDKGGSRGSCQQGVALWMGRHVRRCLHGSWRVSLAVRTQTAGYHMLMGHHSTNPASPGGKGSPTCDRDAPPTVGCLARSPGAARRAEALPPAPAVLRAAGRFLPAAASAGKIAAAPLATAVVEHWRPAAAGLQMRQPPARAAPPTACPCRQAGGRVAAAAGEGPGRAGALPKCCKPPEDHSHQSLAVWKQPCGLSRRHKWPQLGHASKLRLHKVLHCLLKLL